MAFQQLRVNVVRTGRTRVDWEKRHLVIRKPKTLPEGKSPDWLQEQGCTVIQAKCDGIHIVLCRDRSAAAMQINEYLYLRVLTTQGHDLFDQYPQLIAAPWWDAVCAATDSSEDNSVGWIDAELYVPGKGREAVKTAIKNDPESLRLAVFGIGWLSRNEDMTLAELADWCYERELEPLPFVEYHLDMTAGFMQDEIKRTGMETDGVVYKSTMYGRWYKLKNQRTIDCVVTGIKMGVGKYWGQCGAIRVSVKGQEIACVSGMTDSDRKHISRADIGRVCEIEYERVASKGRLQHPRFVCFRDDKQAHECTLDQDERLVEYYVQDQ